MFSSGNLMNARLLQQLAQRMPQGAPGAQPAPQLPGARDPRFMQSLTGLMNFLRQRQGNAAPISSPGAPDMGMGGQLQQTLGNLPRDVVMGGGMPMGGASSAPATLPGFGAQPPMTQTGAMAQMGAPQMRNNFSAPMPFMALSSGNLATPAIMQRLGVAEMMRNAGMMNQPAPQPMQPTEPPMAPQAGMAPNEQMFARGGFAVKRAC